MKDSIKLMDLCRGGGCGCKLPPGVLDRLLRVSGTESAGSEGQAGAHGLLVGNNGKDDAAAWDLGDGTCVIATADFFMPIVNSPYYFGRIAAANALSDVYAMGARPLLALALFGLPAQGLPESAAARIMAGGGRTCALAGAPVAGGHSINSAEPLYGLAVVGQCATGNLVRNGGARDGDALVLGKPLGVGVLGAALKKGSLSRQGYRELLVTACLLNEVGAVIAEQSLANAMTDVTGFGLLGHLLEMCAGAGMSATVRWPRVPLLGEAIRLARAGLATGASARNWSHCRSKVSLDNGLGDWQRTMLTDPQTSGGLLVACAPENVVPVLDIFSSGGLGHAARIGSFDSGPPYVRIRL